MGETLSCIIDFECAEDAVRIGQFHTHPRIFEYVFHPESAVDGQPETSYHSPPDYRTVLFADRGMVENKLRFIPLGFLFVDCVGDVPKQHVSCLTRKADLPDDFRNMFKGKKGRELYAREKALADIVDEIFVGLFRGLKPFTRGKDRNFVNELIRAKKRWTDLKYPDQQRLARLGNLHGSKIDTEPLDPLLEQGGDLRETIVGYYKAQHRSTSSLNPDFLAQMFDLHTFFVPEKTVKLREVGCDADECFTINPKNRRVKLGFKKRRAQRMAFYRGIGTEPHTTLSSDAPKTVAVDEGSRCVVEKKFRAVICGTPEEFRVPISQKFLRRATDLKKSRDWEREHLQEWTEKKF